MTKFQALFIKYLRVRLDGSWRWVAQKYEDRYTNKEPFSFENTLGGNQIDGIYLCEGAMLVLNEKHEEGWN